MLSPEDRVPAVLQGYDFTDFSAIEVNLEAMARFAQELMANLEDYYAPRMSTVSDTMTTELPGPPTFQELHSFLDVHRTAQEVAHLNVYNYANGTFGFASTAQEIGEKYAGSDAFAHAKVADVNAGLDKAGIPPGPDDRRGHL